MADLNHERRLDELLDRRLAGYSNVQPRPGLEARILANLAAADVTERRAWLRWWPALSLAAAAMLVLLMLVAMPKRMPSTNVVRQVPAAPQTISQARSLPPVAKVPPSRPHIRRHILASLPPQPPVPPVQQRAALVKKDTFPSASPLTEQEKLLFAYLRRTPAHEVVALARPDEIIDVFQHPDQKGPAPARPTDRNLAK